MFRHIFLTMFSFFCLCILSYIYIYIWHPTRWLKYTEYWDFLRFGSFFFFDFVLKWSNIFNHDMKTLNWMYPHADMFQISLFLMFICLKWQMVYFIASGRCNYSLISGAGSHIFLSVVLWTQNFVFICLIFILHWKNSLYCERDVKSVNE